MPAMCVQGFQTRRETESVKKAVQFGAGNIGRGFIGQLFSESGYEWKAYDMGAGSFSHTFEYILPGESTSQEDEHPLIHYVTRQLEEMKEKGGSLTAVELGCPGSNLFADFPWNL